MTLAIITVAALALSGILLRHWLPLLQKFHIPASVAGGAVGLVIVLFIRLSVDDGFARPMGELPSVLPKVLRQLSSWPGFLIAVVFAGMLLPHKPGGEGKRSFANVGREGLMVWIIVLGQTAIGCWITWLILRPWFSSPDVFGMLIETGFAGGHGTAAAMGSVLESPQIGISGGTSLGVLMATAGLVYGVVSGVLWINIGIARGWAAYNDSAPTVPMPESANLTRPTLQNDAPAIDVEPWLLQMIWLTLAVGVGMGLQWAVTVLAETAETTFSNPPEINADPMQQRTSLSAIAGSFPLFIYTLAGGWIVRRVVVSCGGSFLIDNRIIERLSGIAMDVLVVAAIASLDVVAVANRWGECVILMTAGAVWTSVCLAVLSRHILPRAYWFELGLINYGMSTGTTATGFVLLRMIDPQLRSHAAEDYALAAPISSPFVGGGMLTFALPLLVLGRFPLPAVAAVLTIIVAAMIVWGVRHRD